MPSCSLRPPQPLSLRTKLSVLSVIATGIVSASRAEGSTCTSFAPGVSLGTVDFTALKESSGLAVSGLNSGVVWTHNDGTGKRIFAMNFSANLLARCEFGVDVDDVEDMAVGPGPVTGTSYVYLFDGGGAREDTGVRNTIQIVRFPEPVIGTTVPESAPTVKPPGVETFTLTYPDGSYDAEALLVDPVTSDLFILTKLEDVTRVYRANLNAAAPGSTASLAFVMTVPFDVASGASVSADGSQILIRNEDVAMLWNRNSGESVTAALGRSPVIVPVIGTPVEPNGEGIAFMRDGSGYLTISEEETPHLYFFSALCPRAPTVTAPLTDKSAAAGGTLVLEAVVSAEPAPAFSWKFNGAPVPNQTGASLTISGVQASHAGTYELTATNNLGSVTTSAVVTVRESLDLRITEVSPEQAAGGAAYADWWELTSFEKEPVNLGGWRFNDDGGGLGTAFQIPANVTIGPGESIVFVEGLTPVQFQSWWGAALPATLQIVTYSGNGLAFSANGDGVRLWNSAAGVEADTVASVDFGASTAGVTFNYDPVTKQFGMLSQAGVNAVFKAAATADIGSPGFYKTPPLAPVLNVTRAANGLRLDFTTVAGTVYILEASDSLEDGSWETEGEPFTAAGNAGGFFDVAVDSGTRFYRVRAQ